MIIKIYNHFMNDSLYRNSIYLMAGTLVMSFFGFFFWAISARLYSSQEIGIATTLISLTVLISSFSLLGLDIGIIRYIPSSKNKNEIINTCFTIVILISIVVSIIFIIGVDIFSPQLAFVKDKIFFALFFVFSMIIMTTSFFIESVYIALRDTKYVLIQKSTFSVIRIVFPFLFISLGAFGIFSSWMIALAIGFIISYIFLIKKFNYKPKPSISIPIIKNISRFSFGNYIASFLIVLPILILPLLITNMISPEVTAYYYMSIMIASLLFVIPRATTESLFAEGSYNEAELKKLVRKSLVIISLLLIPGILITILFGKYILLAFGNEYANEGFRFLQILAFSGIFVGINLIFSTILQVKHKIRMLIFINLIGAIIILGLSYLFIAWALIGIGLAWIIGQITMCIIHFVYANLLFKYSRFTIGVN